jgi:hypothetical protein
VIYPMLGGICALPRVRKQESPQRHGGTEQKSQVMNLIFFSVSLCLCASVVILYCKDLSKARISPSEWYARLPNDRLFNIMAGAVRPFTTFVLPTRKSWMAGHDGGRRTSIISPPGMSCQLGECGGMPQISDDRYHPHS